MIKLVLTAIDMQKSANCINKIRVTFSARCNAIHRRIKANR